jgi:hypothetical protein
LPRQMRLPPKNGQKEKGFLVFPSGLRNIFELGSNRSGSYLSGSIHSLGSLWMKQKLIEKLVSGVKSIPFIRIVF